MVVSKFKSSIPHHGFLNVKDVKNRLRLRQPGSWCKLLVTECLSLHERYSKVSRGNVIDTSTYSLNLRESETDV